MDEQGLRRGGEAPSRRVWRRDGAGWAGGRSSPAPAPWRTFTQGGEAGDAGQTVLHPLGASDPPTPSRPPQARQGPERMRFWPSDGRMPCRESSPNMRAGAVSSSVGLRPGGCMGWGGPCPVRAGYPWSIRDSPEGQHREGTTSNHTGGKAPATARPAH